MAIDTIKASAILDGAVDSADLADSAVTSAKIADTAITTAKVASDFSVSKNLIINGAMQIAQRGTSATGVTAYGYHTVDRFNQHIVNCGTWTISQDTDAPDGFSNSLKLACTTADASPAASDRVGIQQRIEGQTLQQLAKGTTSAKSVTLSFWIKSNKTGNIQVGLYDFDNTRQIANTVTINSSATWEKKTITFAGDTTGVLDNDNNLSLLVEWWFDSGTDYSSGSVPTSWEAVVDADRSAGTTLALADSTSNYVNITGVQLELGESATEFEHRPYGLELQLCQRYFEAFKKQVGPNTVGLIMLYRQTNQYWLNLSYNTTKRASPTFGLGPGIAWSGSISDITLSETNAVFYSASSNAYIGEANSTGTYSYSFDAEL